MTRINTADAEGAVYIGRPTIFGNPYRIGPDGDRAAVIEQYQAYFDQRVDEDDEFRRAVLGLLGRDLACHCAPLLCHGDVILDWLWTQFDDLGEARAVVAAREPAPQLPGQLDLC